MACRTSHSGERQKDRGVLLGPVPKPYTKGGIARFRLQPRSRHRLRRPLSGGDRQAHWSHSTECSSKPAALRCDRRRFRGLTRAYASSRGFCFAARAGAILLSLRRSDQVEAEGVSPCQTREETWVRDTNNSNRCDNHCVFKGARQKQPFM